MIETTINERWSLLLPEHRAVRPEWPVWEKERLDSMYRNLQPGDVVYDVGAEEGDMPALYQTWVGGEGGVVLVEPNPKVWPNIRAIWDANALPKPLGWFVGFCSTVTETPQATDVRSEVRDGWPECAYGPLIGDHGFRHLSQETDYTPQITLDDLADRTGRVPTAITMDVEGSELSVLRGAERTLATHPLVWVAVHPEFIEEMYGVTADHVHEFMRERGYHAVLLAKVHEEHWLYWHDEGRAPQL